MSKSSTLKPKIESSTTSKKRQSGKVVGVKRWHQVVWIKAFGQLDSLHWGVFAVAE